MTRDKIGYPGTEPSAFPYILRPLLRVDYSLSAPAIRIAYIARASYVNIPVLCRSLGLAADESAANLGKRVEKEKINDSIGRELLTGYYNSNSRKYSLFSFVNPDRLPLNSTATYKSQKS